MLNLKLPRSKPLRISVIVILALLVMVGLSYLGRGWIRVTGVDSFNTIFYKHSVDATYDKQFKSINTLLETSGINFKNPLQHTDGCPGDDSYFSGIHIDSSCLKSVDTTPVEISQRFISSWHQVAPKLQAQLDGAGWKSNNPLSDMAFRNLFDNPAYGGFLQYAKTDGSVSCTLSIGPGNDLGKLLPNETCFREIDYFGGI